MRIECKAYSETAQLVGLIGPYNSYCAFVRAAYPEPGGERSVPIISPANTETGLTRAAPGVPRGQPESGYPTGVRNYLRVVPPDDLQGAADAVFAKRLGLRKVYVMRDDYVDAASGFTRAARRIGLPIAGFAVWPAHGSYAALARRVARSGADGVLLGGLGFNGGYDVLRALRARLGREFPIIVTDAFFTVPQFMKVAGPAAVTRT